MLEAANEGANPSGGPLNRLLSGEIARGINEIRTHESDVNTDVW